MPGLGTGPELPRFVVDMARRVGGSLDLQHTLDQVVAAVVELLGFQVAALNLLGVDGSLEVVSVAGPADSREQLLGSRQPAGVWSQVLAAAKPIGSLRFLHHDDTALLDGLLTWDPDIEPSDDPGAWHPLDALFAPLLGSTGELLGVLSVDCPVDGRQPDEHTCQLLELFAVQTAVALDNARVYDRLERSEQLFRSMFDQAPVGMAVYGPDRRITSANRAFCTFLGRAPHELVGHRIAEFSHPEDLAATERMSTAVRAGGGIYRADKRYLHADGSVVWGRVSLTPIRDERGLDRVLAQVEDITAERSARAELERRARTDALTGLSNRHEVMQALSAALAADPRVAVLFCDIDHFKQVNDAFGHATGDEVLVEVARVLSAVLRPGDRAGRLGGDEFVLVLQGVTRAEDALAVAERVRRAARRTVTREGRSVLTSLTIGVALASPGQADRDVLAAADRALYVAKERGRNQTAVSPVALPVAAGADSA